jgi:predicted TIM-barrel fold metal-dependent hydrolase
VRGDLPGGFFTALAPYLTEHWQKRFESHVSLPGIRYEPTFTDFESVDGQLWGSASPDGAPGGTDPKWTSHHLLDRHNVAAALLISLQHGQSAYMSCADSVVLAAALNDQLVHEWLACDKRYRLAVGVAAQDPVAAAKEIRRHADNDQVIAVHLPTVNILMGEPYYDPIYDAAQECGMTIVNHFTAADGTYQGAPTLPVGIPSYVVERNVDYFTLAHANIVSLIFHGTFERFPELKCAFLEYGFAWLSYTMWKSDEMWRAMRRETPWVTRPPSEYILEHVKLSSQPIIDHGEHQKHLPAVLEMIHAETTMVFSTDYPHWDTDFPDTAMAKVPRELRPRILVDNALDHFPRLERDDLDLTSKPRPEPAVAV